MPIMRKQSTIDYTHINNDVLNDKSLSFRARGIAAYLMSKPNGWMIRIEAIARDGKEGRDSIRSALAELATLGYVKRGRERNEKGHLTTITLVSDTPLYINDGTPEERVRGITSTDLLENRMTENGHVGEGGVIVTTGTVTTELEETNTLTKQKTVLSKEAQPPSLDQDVDFAMGKRTKEEIDESISPLRHSPAVEKKEPEVSEWDKEKDHVWDNAPGATSQIVPPGPTQPTLGISPVEETNAFARPYTQLDGAPDIVRRVSFLLHQNTGFIPAGTKSSWIQQVNLLWEAARHSEKILIDGLQKGEEARQKSGLTYSGPRGYVSFVRNEAAVPVKTVARRSNANPNRHGQTVQQVNGKTIVTMT